MTTTSLKPVVTTSLQPVVTTSLQPVVTTSLQPVVTTSLKPVVTTSLKPVVTTSLKPVVTTSLKPVVTTSLQSDKIYEITTPEMVYLIFALLINSIILILCLIFYGSMIKGIYFKKVADIKSSGIGYAICGIIILLGAGIGQIFTYKKYKNAVKQDYEDVNPIGPTTYSTSYMDKALQAFSYINFIVVALILIPLVYIIYLKNKLPGSLEKTEPTVDNFY